MHMSTCYSLPACHQHQLNCNYAVQVHALPRIIYEAATLLRAFARGVGTGLRCRRLLNLMFE